MHTDIKQDADTLRTDGITRGRLVAAALPLAALVAYYHDVAVQLGVRWWNDPNYSHGFFVPMFSLYFLWERRRDIAEVPVRWSALGVPVMLAAAALRMFGHLIFSPYIAGMSLVVMLAGAVIFCFGLRLTRQLWLPIAFLVLMLPLPTPAYEAVALPLQRFAAIFATKVLHTVGIPVLREGNVIHFAGKSLEVAQACSGMRLLIGFVAMGIAVAHLSKRPIWHKSLLVASTFPIAIVANAVRVAGTGILYNTMGEAAAEGFFHAFSGWLLFVIALGLLALESFALSLLFAPRNTDKRQ